MNPRVETQGGTLEGLQHGGHQSFLGIPYARPPVGERRFAAPEPPEPWVGLRPARQFAASCPQGADHPVAGFAASGHRDEDCLYLNVYTPAADGEKRPVLFWIHGGAFTYGSGSELIYDGGPLAERGDVVVVTIHYRLGAFGYLFLGEHGGDAWGAADNVGQRDQVAALQWVRANIEHFGGDPDNVTLFGESAGAVAVSTLLAMPAARGLFRRAVAQSGTAARLGPPRVGAAVAVAFLKQLGMERADAAALRALPASAIVEAQLKVQGFAPVHGAESVPEAPLGFFRAGGARDLDVIVGTNRDEVKLFAPKGRAPIDDQALEKAVAATLPRHAKDRVAEVIALYRESRRARELPTDNLDILDAVSTDSRFRIPATRMVEALGEHRDSRLYLFDWESPARRGAFGACHALEMPFVFGTLSAPYQDRFAGKGPAAERLAHQMMDAWTGFARDGEPSHEDIGRWPGYEPERRPTMIFGPSTSLAEAPFEEERALWYDLLEARTS